MTIKENNISSIPEAFDPHLSVQRNESSIRSWIEKQLLEADAQSFKSQKLSYGPQRSIIDFFTLFQDLIRYKESVENVQNQHRLLVLEDDPPENLDSEAITFELWNRVPGMINGGSIREGRVREVVPHIRSVRKNPDIPSEQLVEMGKFYDNIVMFYCYARTVKVARNRALWLEKLLDNFRWYFKFYGCDIIEDAMHAKEKINVGNINLIRYPLSYFVRTDDTFCLNSQELMAVIINTTVSRT